MTAKEISDHVSQEWDGVYITRKGPKLDVGQVWETILRVPDGDKVFTLERADGSLVDITRR